MVALAALRTGMGDTGVVRSGRGCT